jgi:hypothetical protein
MNDASDQTRTIEDDVHCSRRHYNLRGLQPTGRCPECGSAIPLSILALDRSGQRPPPVAAYIVSVIAAYAPFVPGVVDYYRYPTRS